LSNSGEIVYVAFPPLLVAVIDEGMKNGKIEISGTDYRMFNLVIETFFLEFFGNKNIVVKKSLY